MEQWEYLTVFVSCEMTSEMEKKLNAAGVGTGKYSRYSPQAMMVYLDQRGAEGWELITCHPYSIGENHDVMTINMTGAGTFVGRQFTHIYLCVFKRRKVNPTAP